MVVHRQEIGLYRHFHDTSGFLRSQQDSRWTFSAAGAHVNFGYGWRGSDRWAWFWNHLRPEVGVALNLLDLDPNESFELGVAGVVSLGDGFLTVGWGRNISVNLGHSKYTFVGTSVTRIIEAITPKK